MTTHEQQEPSTEAYQSGLRAWTDGWEMACRAATAARLMVKNDTPEARKAWAAVLMEAMDKQMTKPTTQRGAAANAAAWYAALAAAEIATRPRTEKDVPLHRRPRARIDTEMRITEGLEAGRAAWIETWDPATLWK